MRDMGEVILREKEWCEDMISKLSLGASPSSTLMRLARYYHSQGKNKKEVVRALEEFLLRCDPRVSLEMWRGYLEFCASRASRRAMIDVDAISVSKNEMETIATLDGLMRQRLMFVILCLAKYGNAINASNNCWVNTSRQEIFATANISMASERQMLLINDLKEAGMIQFSKKIDNVNMRAAIVSDGEPELHITDFRNLGIQYLRYTGVDCCECSNCGIVVRRHSNRQVYCRDCAAEISQQQVLLSSRYSGFDFAKRYI